MKMSKRIKNITDSIRYSFERFPLTVLTSTAVVILLITLSEMGTQFTPVERDKFIRFTMTVALGIPLSACIKFIYERIEDRKKLFSIIGYLLGIAFLILYYFFFLKALNWVSIARYIGLSLVLYLAFFFIPWFKKKAGYEYYIIDILFNFIITAIYSFVLFFGIVIILFTIVQLFNVDIPDKFVYYSFLIIAGIFAPSLFLAKIPQLKGDSYKIEYPKALKVLLLYIVIPLITVYSIILYVYFMKIIITRNWPQGLVSHLVLWYSVVSVAVIFLISPILADNKLAYRFKFLFPKFILPILAMMFISMGIRINAYGITESRYFALVLGLWVLGVMVYFSLKKKLTNIVIPISLSIVILLSIIGPVSSFSVSKFSQNNRLKNILEQNSMLTGEGISKKEDIPREDKEEISAILMYFENRHSLKDVKYIPEDFQMENMEEVFGFPYTEKRQDEADYFSYYMNYEDRKALDIKDYDYYINSITLMQREVEVEGLTISYENNTIRIVEDQLIYEWDLKDPVSKLLTKEKQLNKYDYQLQPEKAIFVNENERIRVKILITSFSAMKELNDEYILDHVEFEMLIDIK